MQSTLRLLAFAAVFALSACPDDATPQGPVADATGDAADTSAPSDAVADAAADTSDVVVERVVQLPLGETLLFDGDDYLYFWGRSDAPVTLVSAPAGATAEIVGGSPGRLTPDVIGPWVLRRGDSRVTIDVADDLLNADTFLNYNYTPTQPLALDAQDRIWVASAMSNAVHRVDVAADGTSTAGPLVPTGSWPTALVPWPQTPYLLVSQAGRDTLGFLDTEVGRVVDAIHVGNEPAGIVVEPNHPDGARAWVALSGADAVVEVDLDNRVVTQTLPVTRDPRAVAYDAATHRLYVASLLSSNATPQGPLTETPTPREEQHDIAVIDTTDFSLVGWINEVATLVRGLHLPPGAPGTLLAAVGHSDNTIASVNATSRPHIHGLAVVDLTGGSADDIGTIQQIDLDIRPGSAGPAASPHTLATSPDGAYLVATLSAGNALLIMDAATLEEVGRIPAGSDPRGLLFAHGRVWAFASLDNLLQSWPLSTLSAPDTAADSMTELSVGADPRPAHIAAGQRLFNDASFSAGKAFSCNNCHIDGITDGLVWNILLDGNVNTLAFRNIGGTGPFLWGGFLPTLFDFSREVLRLVGAEPSTEDMANLTAYMQSVTAPPNPYADPGGRYTQAAERGRLVFDGLVGADNGAGCAVCHSGPLLTNRQVVAGKTADVMTDVPSLIGVYDTGPWGRLGQWTTLHAMVEYAAQFTGATLAPQDMADLQAYVRELPGDLLYMTAAKPLDGTSYTFPGVDISLTFSGVLQSGQEDLFSLVATSDGDRLLEGAWDISGRYARFTPVEATLPLNSTFEITVAEGLQGVLGQATRGPTTVRFETGGVPSVDITGPWLLGVSGLVSGEVVVSFIQSPGGQVSGVVLDGGGLVDLDHLEGFVSDDVLIIEPFEVQTGFVGTVQVDGIQSTMVDNDGDGAADTGSGEILNAFADVSATWTRLDTYCPTCCIDDDECVDNDHNTVDSCIQGACVNEPLACAEDAECVHWETACLVGTCQTQQCVFQDASWANCCDEDYECPWTASTESQCINNQCVMTLPDEEASACVADSACGAPGSCVAYECASQAGVCTVVGSSGGPGCCESAPECPAPTSGDLCDVAVCQAYECGVVTLQDEKAEFAVLDFDDWTVASDASGAHWHVLPGPPFGKSLIYSNPDTNGFDVGPTTGSATSAVVATPGPSDLLLSVNGYVIVDPTPGTDVLTIEVLEEGQPPHVLFTGDQGAIIDFASPVELPFSVADDFQVRVTFDSVDGQDNSGSVILDRVAILVSCPAP